MAEEMVKVSCRLPHGIVLEVGYSVVSQGKDENRHVSVQQHEDYRRVLVKGWTYVDGSKQAYHSGLLLPPNTSLSDPKVAITDVPKAIWERWKREHKAMWGRLNKSGVLQETTDAASAASAVAIQKTVKSQFEAKDPTAPAPNVTKANFDSDE